MTANFPRRVDFDQIGWLLEVFKAESTAKEKLYHVTRVVLDNTLDSASREQYWDEFRRKTRFFGFRAYDSGLTRSQHVCYHGSEKRLLDYTGLAAKAAVQLPGIFAAMWDHVRNPSSDRDAWTWAMYRVALRVPDYLPVDVEGDGEYARVDPSKYPWLHQAVANSTKDEDRLRDNVRAWGVEVARKSGFTPRYIYGSLALDVFTSSAVTLDYLLHHAEEFYFPKTSLPVFGPRYFKITQEEARSNSTRINLAVQVDRKNSRVTYLKVSYEVEPDGADFAAVVCDAGGEWITGPRIGEILGVSNYRADRAYSQLPSPLRYIFESKRNAGYRVNVEKLPSLPS